MAWSCATDVADGPLPGIGFVRLASNADRVWAVAEAEPGDREVMARVWSSVDGVEWSKGEAARVIRIDDAAAGPDGLVVVGSRYRGDVDEAAVWTIRDTEWELADWKRTKVRPFIDDRADPSYDTPSEVWTNLEAVAWRGDRWFAFGYWNDGSGSGAELRIFESTDGHRWAFVDHVETGGDYGYWVNAAAASPEAVATVGENGGGDSPDFVEARALSSVDGEHWPKRDVGLGTGSLHDVAAWKDGFIASGYRWVNEPLGDDYGSSVPMFAVSSDGASWKSIDDPTSTSTRWDEELGATSTVDAIAAGEGSLIAIGRSNDASTVWTSPDGRTWSPNRNLPAELSEAQLVDVTAAGSRVIVAALAQGQRLTLCSADV